VVLAPLNARGYLLVKRLDAHLKLQCAWRELGNRLAQRRRQPVRDHLKMQEQPRSISLVEELQNGPAGPKVQIEGAIDKLEVLHTALEQLSERPQKLRQWKLPDRDVERRQAELTRERATP